MIILIWIYPQVDLNFINTVYLWVKRQRKLDEINESFLITESTKAMSIELEDMYIYGVLATINCTAIMNPNTTKVFLIGIATNHQILIPTNDKTTLVEPANDNDCKCGLDRHLFSGLYGGR